MAILNYTTKIDAHQTVSEIQRLLAKGGAKKVLVEYDAKTQPASVMFELDLQGTPMHYRLPCRYVQVQKVLFQDTKVDNRYTSEKHALNVAWRIVKDWIEAQLALVQSQQSDMNEVFFQYGITKSGETVYEHVVRTRYLLEDKSTE